MRLKSIILALASVSALAQTPAEPNFDEIAAAYFGTALRQTIADMECAGVCFNRDAFAQMLADIITGKTKPTLSLQQAESLLQNAMKPQRPPAVEPKDPIEENKWVHEQLLLPDTRELDNGVILQIIKEGNGETPKPNSKLMVMYTGRLSSGVQFDQTDEPFLMPVNGVIQGLSIALQNMRVGGTYRVFIPPAQAYGAEAVMDLIPGYSALDFTITIQEIKR